MSKKLRKVIAVGNSLAVVLGTELCRLKRIDRTTKVKVFLEDERIVIEPIIGPRVPRNHAERVRLFLALTQLPGFTSEYYDRLRHDDMDWMKFARCLQFDTPVDPITIERIAACFERRRDLQRARSDEPWSVTVNVAIALVPRKPPTASTTAAPTDATQAL